MFPSCADLFIYDMQKKICFKETKSFLPYQWYAGKDIPWESLPVSESIHDAKYTLKFVHAVNSFVVTAIRIQCEVC